ncbi:MFS transporter [Candidatus Sulfidibacterium hydrothermale]|uniref:MFS transporter n=1 Tax=Candidatus Sulfidibacterium hydrothermale TaxID=2875962 RepID=UPI001F0A6274|nr:MFS transporter [Candidatus Sulfidibacterium hydrothermale]UBM62049.1 MFS transporter [Candidatus Sulfidibacterium hydrothermale]
MTEAIQKSLRESPVARWTAMFVVSMSMFGAYYFNYVGSTIKPILETALGWTSRDIGVYTGSYAWFNVFLLMLIFSGLILDKLGIRITGLWATAMMAIGTALNYWAMTSMPAHMLSMHVTLPFIGQLSMQVFLSCLGFAIFGIGSEATGITLSKAIVKWFKGKELALAMGLQMSIARLGTALALAVSLPLAIKYTYSTPILLAFVLMLLGLVAFIVYVIMDIKLDKSEENIEIEEEEPFRVKDIVSIVSNKAFWYIAILCVLFYGAVFPFLFFAPDFVINKYHVAPNLAGYIPALLPAGTIVLTPLFGYIYDRKGKGATIMIIGAVMLLLVHSFLAVPGLNHWIFAAILVIILGIAFSLVPSAMWPSVPKIIPENQLGTAYAVIFYIQNIGLFIIPTILGVVLTMSNPSVNPNKMLIKSSIEQSFQKALAAKQITYNKKDLKIAIDKATGRVVDSIVQNTFYTPTPEKEINKTTLQNNIIANNINAAAQFNLIDGSRASLLALATVFTKTTYPIIEKEKLNITYNYENDILIFVLLGVLSVIFGFLLKAEDKKKGYGLELPNMEK